MHTIHFDSRLSDNARRGELYSGQLFVFAPRPATRALCEFAREMIEEAFRGLDPRRAQYSMPVEEYVAIVAPLKPQFIHHPRTKQLVRDVMEEMGCNLDETYIDVPRLRMVTSDGYLTSGVGYAHHPHRDTWYSAPMQQLNHWLPIYDIVSENSMAFHPRYWSEPVKNGSREFNYYEWNSTGRMNAAAHVKADTRKQPKPEQELELDPQVRLICNAGGNIVFSAAQLHSTVPNTAGVARYSIDFRTVNLADLRARRAAPNIDSEPQGTSLRDFVRASDLSPMPAEVVAMYENAEPTSGIVTFRPEVIAQI